MVSVVNNTNLVNKTILSPKQDDIKNLLKYSSNQAIKEVPDTFTSTVKGGMGFAAVYEGIPLFNFLKRGKKVKGIRPSESQTIMIKDAMKAMDKKTSDALKNIFKGTEGTLGERVLNYFSTQNQVKKDYINLKGAVKSTQKATKTVAKGKNYEAILSSIDDATKAADYFVDPKKIDLNRAKQVAEEAAETLAKKPNSKLLKFKNAKANKNLVKLTQAGAKGTNKFKSLMKSSGAGFTLVLSGVTEALTEVIPTFQELGVKKGIKQLAKSSVKVVIDTVGFIAGEQLGTAIGSAVGTAIMPGIGTAVGAVVGFLGGVVGSFVAGKVTRGLVGKPEREIAKEQQQNELAKQLETDVELLEELKKSVNDKIKEEIATTGQLSEDSQIALQSLKNLETTNPFLV